MLLIRLEAPVLTRLARVLAYLSPLACATIATAQEAVTITGHVSASASPIRGAEIRVPELGLAAVSDAEGRYSFIVPSARVRGQTVTLTVRYLRYRAESATLALVGGSVTMDFNMRLSAALAERSGSPPSPSSSPETPVARLVSAATPATTVRVASSSAFRRVVDASAFAVASGPAEFPTLLAGRVGGLDVRSASSAGGSVALQFRGPRSLLGTTEPLFVVDGVLLDNESITTAAQRNGTGGFDVGSAVNALEIPDVASVELLSAAEAALRYGGRAANGVLLVSTRSARGLGGVAVSASQQVSFERPLRLPSYQDAYGQGLGGRFTFFNGRGGGVNDSVSQSWGPALDGSPVIQASLTEAGRPIVRAFLPQPDNVRDYFERGRMLTTNVAVQGASETRNFRLSATNRSNRALTPGTSLSRQSLAFTGGVEPTPRSALGTSVRYSFERASELPGTGMDESNPVSVLAITPRQVDIVALRAHLLDGSRRQVNWNYSGHDNPFFTALENQNRVRRTQLLASISGTSELTASVRAAGIAGVHRASQVRELTVAPGFIGGFPFFSGRSDSTGSENDDLTATSMNVDAGLRAAVTVPVALTLGIGARSSGLDVTNSGFSRAGSGPTPAPLPFTTDTRAVYVRGTMEAVGDAGSIVVGARGERMSTLSSSVSRLYPSVIATLDLAQLMPGSRQLGSLSLRAAWSRSGNDPSPFILQRLGLGRGVADGSLLFFARPELTSGWEAGIASASGARRVEVDLRAYHELSENLLLPSFTRLLRGGSVSNNGFEAQLRIVPLRVGDVAEWQVGVNWARNQSRVESLADQGSAIVLASGPGGLLLQARVGEAPGSLVGSRFRRDAAGALVLRDGLPLPDSAGPQLLGSAAPRWIGGATSSIRYRGIELSAVVDGRVGGSVFSASNQAAAFAGVAAETAFRPDTGLLIDGRDVVTGTTNTVHVSTEDYYHALGPITERWIYDATFFKLREARLAVELPVRSLPLFRSQSARLTFIGRNLALWSRAPNIDPETVLSTSPLLGVEMGQLPSARSIGVQLTLAP